MRKLFLVAAAAGAMVAVPAAAAPSPVGATMTVKASVAKSCVVDNATLDFGSYDPTSTTADDASTDIGITCTKGTNYTVTLDDGKNVSGGVRRMKDTTGGTEFLNYTLFSDAARTTSFPAAGHTPAAASGIKTNVSVYGRIAAGQTVSALSFEDTVAVTVTF